MTNKYFVLINSLRGGKGMPHGIHTLTASNMHELTWLVANLGLTQNTRLLIQSVLLLSRHSPENRTRGFTNCAKRAEII